MPSDRSQPEYNAARQIPDRNREPIHDGNRDEQIEMVRRVLNHLRPRSAEILRLRYGLNGDPLSLRQIGARLQITKERVRQIQRKIVLIDGAMLANLMIDYDIGVSAYRTFTLKRLDADYFDE